MKKRSKKLVLSNQGKIIINTGLIVIFGILMIISFTMLLSSLGIFSPKQYQVLYSYNITNGVNYKVNLLENDFIDSESLGSNDTYIASLIDNIEINFSQVLSGSRVKNFDLEYDIIARVEGLYSDSQNGDSSVWSKEYPLIENKKLVVEENNTYSINETVNVVYSMYDREVQKFKNELKLPIDSYLYVIMNISDNSSEYAIDPTTYKVTIPLDEQAFKITSEYVPTINDSERKLVDSEFVISYSSVGIYGALFGISFIIFIRSFFVLWSKVKKNDYIRALRKILKDYDDIIVETDSDFDLEKYDVVSIKSFKELLDLEEELRLPILHYQKSITISFFSIVHQNILYRYYFTEKDILTNDYKD